MVRLTATASMASAKQMTDAPIRIFPRCDRSPHADAPRPWCSNLARIHREGPEMIALVLCSPEIINEAAGEHTTE